LAQSTLLRLRQAAGLTRLALTNPQEFIRFVQFRNGPPRLGVLERLISQAKPRVLVEIGVWRGDTAARMIRAAARHRADIRYWGFDLFEGMSDEILKREISLAPLSQEEVSARLAGLEAEIHLIAGNSAHTLAVTDLPPVEFAFVDGGHSYETVAADWRGLRPHLAPGALVVFDDYTNELPVEREGFGVRRLVRELSSSHDVELLKPIDTFPRVYGRLEIQLALLRMPA